MEFTTGDNKSLHIGDEVFYITTDFDSLSKHVKESVTDYRHFIPKKVELIKYVIKKGKVVGFAKYGDHYRALFENPCALIGFFGNMFGDKNEDKVQQEFISAGTLVCFFDELEAKRQVNECLELAKKKFLEYIESYFNDIKV